VFATICCYDLVRVLRLESGRTLRKFARVVVTVSLPRIFPKVTLGQAYEQYLNDPAHSWSARTREAFETSRKMAEAVIGANTPLMTLSRAQCRDYIEVLRFLPRNAAKRFPKLTPRQASEVSKDKGSSDTISVANVNVYLGTRYAGCDCTMRSQGGTSASHSQPTSCGRFSVPHSTGDVLMVGEDMQRRGLNVAEWRNGGRTIWMSSDRKLTFGHPSLRG
jgi:hypothetical protein